jgi:hypothetical protein
MLLVSTYATVTMAVLAMITMLSIILYFFHQAIKEEKHFRMIGGTNSLRECVKCGSMQRLERTMEGGDWIEIAPQYSSNCQCHSFANYKHSPNDEVYEIENVICKEIHPLDHSA